MPATYIALLRGVNVGGAKRVPMADFRALLAELGYTHISTLLNSGNAVFEAASGSGKPKLPAQTIAHEIAQAIAKRLKIEVPVIVKTARELTSIVADNTLAPRADEQAAALSSDASRWLVAFAADAATLAGLAPIAALVTPPEKFLLGRQAAYLHCAGGVLESKAGAALLGQAALAGRVITTRNWATTLKLHALANALANGPADGLANGA